MAPSKIHFVLFCCLLSIFVLLFNSCKNDNTIVTPSGDYTPMWPMSGYNCRQSHNPFGAKAKIEPINGLNIYWSDTIPFLNAGGKSCSDAIGNIYVMVSSRDTSKIYKIRYDGTVIWKRDTFIVNGNNGFALSNDETKIYYIDKYKLSCLDSCGNKQWSLNTGPNPCTPVIGKDGTIYISINNILSAINPDGTIKWQALQFFISSSNPVLDRDGNIYYSG